MDLQLLIGENMKRFINPKRQTIHNKAITDFTKNTHVITSGFVKGYSSNKFSWIADYLFKHKGNISIKPHTCYTGFFSERDILQNEYGNVFDLYNRYPFLSDYNYSIFPKNYFELSTKQYFKIGQKLSEYDIIEFINFSNIDVPIPDDLIVDYLPTYNISHNYYRVPAFYAQGYKLDLNQAIEGNDFKDWTYYYRYVFTNKSFITNYTVNVNNFIITLLESEEDIYKIYNGMINETMQAIFEDQDPERIFNYNGSLDSEFFYFNESLMHWSINNNNIMAGTEKYYPYFGFVQKFNENMEYIIDPYESPSLDLFFPEVCKNGAIEPSKIIINWNNEQKGSLAYNPCIHMGLFNDQSRMVYNVCKHMLRRIGPEDPVTLKSLFELKKNGEYTTDIILYGIDTETERNRRNSAVVTTEPYMIAKPIADGQFVNISFINYNGTPICRTEDMEFLRDPAIYLKIKASSSFFKDLNYYLSLNDYNTDIINTIFIKNPRAHSSNFNSADEHHSYEDFGSDPYSLLMRQEYCLDDFVYGYIGTESEDNDKGIHIEFWIDPVGNQIYNYSNSKIKVNGAGFYCNTIIDGDKKILPEHNEYLVLYCSNYSPTSSPHKNDNTQTPIPNTLIKLFTDSETSIISKISENEKFKPMIKLPGINGYIKILEQNNHFKISRASDGDYEIIYNVEFPFCPGSYIERLTMRFNDDHPYIPLQVLYKANYINAGSCKSTVEEGSTYDSTNERYAPIADDCFVPHQIFRNHQFSIYGKDIDLDSNIISNSYFPDLSDIETFIHHDEDASYVFPYGKPEPSYTNDSIVYINEKVLYPEHAILKSIDEELMTIVKPDYENYKHHGMYTLILSENGNNEKFTLPFFSSDIKILLQVSNAVWKFNNNYISYIGNEYPANIFKINVSTIFKDFTTYQKDHGAIPDAKRWLYSYFKGFAYMASIVDNPQSNQNYTNINNENLLATYDSNSNIVIEIWDSKSNIGNDKKGNWRPLSIVITDNKKKFGELIIDNLIILNNITPALVEGALDVWKVYATYCNNPIWFIPSDINNYINGKNNLVLYNPISNVNETNFHIAYVESSIVSDVNTITLYVRYDGDLITDWADVIYSIENIPSYGSLSIYKPLTNISKNPDFIIKSNKMFNAENVIRYLDMRSLIGLNGFSDFDRYVQDEFIFFRTRIRRTNDYPASYIDEDYSEIQYIGNPNPPNTRYSPWYKDGDFDNVFTWSKLKFSEYINKFGMSYFKCASK